MGSPTSGIYAEIFTDFYILKKKLYLKNSGIKYIRKYVDDFIMIGNVDGHLDLIKCWEKDMKLKFTTDEEHNGCIDYLDIKIIRDGNILRTR